MWSLYFWRPPFALRSCIINLKSGDVLKGLVWRTRGGWIVLKDAFYLKAGQPPVRIDGEATAHRDAIDFVQMLP